MKRTLLMVLPSYDGWLGWSQGWCQDLITVHLCIRSLLGCGLHFLMVLFYAPNANYYFHLGLVVSVNVIFFVEIIRIHFRVSDWNTYLAISHSLIHPYCGYCNTLCTILYGISHTVYSFDENPTRERATGRNFI